MIDTDCRSRIVENFQKSRDEAMILFNAVRYAFNALAVKKGRISYLWYDKPEHDYAQRYVQSYTEKYWVSSRQYTDAIANQEAMHSSAVAKAASEFVDVMLGHCAVQPGGRLKSNKTTDGQTI